MIASEISPNDKRTILRTRIQLTIYLLPLIESDPFVSRGHIESISEQEEARWTIDAGLCSRRSSVSVGYHSQYNPQWDEGRFQE